jgi:hypothetical protein
LTKESKYNELVQKRTNLENAIGKFGNSQNVNLNLNNSNNLNDNAQNFRALQYLYHSYILEINNLENDFIRKQNNNEIISKDIKINRLLEQLKIRDEYIHQEKKSLANKKIKFTFEREKDIKKIEDLNMGSNNFSLPVIFQQDKRLNTQTIMNDINKNSSRMKNHLNFIKSNSMIKLGNKNKFKDFEKIKIFKGKAVEILNNNELNKTNKNELKLSKEFNKRNIYLYKKNFNYSCNVDKSNTFSLRLNNNPKDNFKERIINLINSQINMENNEFKYPRMVNIIKRNNFIYDEVAYQPWKYPDIFSK